MDIEMSSSGELLELKIAGVLDNESATQFRDVIDEAIRDDWHRILVRLGGVNYLSSAGIGALLATKKRLTGLKGFFGICDLQSDVERVLKQTRVLDRLLCNPNEILADVPMGTMTLMSKMRVASQDGVDLQIFRLGDEPSALRGETAMTCRCVGDPAAIGAARFDSADCRGVRFPKTAIGLGLGSLGDDFESCRERFGEFLAVAGTVAQSPLKSGDLPDYSVALGDFVPQVQVMYGVRCEGTFSQLIRFSSSDHEQSLPIPLSSVVRLAMQAIDCSAAAVVVLGECAGLVGTQLRKSPAAAEPIALTASSAVVQQATGGADSSADRFAFPQIRDWLSFSAEQVHRHSLALAAGVAVSSQSNSLPALEPFLRPFDSDGKLAGHFHAAVFPYRPLKKRTLDLSALVSELFDSGAIEDVLHLIRDDRPVRGAGESEFVSGACWIAPLVQESVD
ncbi:anti-sigma factor antagonist [bacterium]|nr:anti-sigma factor antagonist [bacterium]